MKFLCKWLCCILCCVGIANAAMAEAPLNGYDSETDGYEYVLLGQYPQTLTGDEKPILWRVIWAQDGRAMLMSESVLANGRIHGDDVEYYYDFAGDFRQTELYAFLNHDFLQTAFREDERRLLETTDELGTVYLPSAEDLKNRAYGFSTDKRRQAYGTEWAIENGLFVYSNDSSPYWTRDPSTTEKGGSRCTKVHGALGYIRCVVMNLGWRPCVTLRLNACEIGAGSGTREDPYTLKEMDFAN